MPSRHKGKPKKGKPKKPRLNPAHVEWCRKMFAKMRDKAIWGIPRNGLLFERQGNELVLIGRQPYHPGMGGSERRWLQYQESQLEETREHFAAAGVTVRDASIPQTKH